MSIPQREVKKNHVVYAKYALMGSGWVRIDNDHALCAEES
jgi:hypothetical protein